MDDKTVITAGGRRITHYVFPAPPNYKVLVLQATGHRHVWYIIQGSITNINCYEVMTVLREVSRPHFSFFLSTVNDMKIKEAVAARGVHMIWIGTATKDVDISRMQIPQNRESGGIWLFREIEPYKLGPVDKLEDDVYYVYSDINIPVLVCTRSTAINGQTRWLALTIDRYNGSLVTHPLTYYTKNELSPDKCRRYYASPDFPGDVIFIVTNAMEWYYRFPEPRKHSPTKQYRTNQNWRGPSVERPTSYAHAARM